MIGKKSTKNSTESPKTGTKKPASANGAKFKDKISINKLFIGLNLLALLLVLYQIFSLLSSYSNKGEELFEQGRVFSINPMTNEVKLKTLSQSEINAKRSKKLDNTEVYGPEFKPKQKTEDQRPPTKEQFEITKPKEDPKKDIALEKDEIYGPMPLTKKEENKELNEEKKEKKKPVFTFDYNKANLAIVITEMGMKQADFELTQNLPKEVNFAISPYSDELQKKIDFAARDGRQVVLNIMLQSANFPVKDNGPLSIQASYDEATINQKLVQTLDSALSYSGVLAINDEVITNKFDKLSPILRKIAERGLFIGYFKGNTNMNVENDAKPLAADVFGIDYLIDEDLTKDKMIKALDVVKEDLLLNNKKLVIAIRPFPNSIEVISNWIDENAGEKIQLAPISYFVTNN